MFKIELEVVKKELVYLMEKLRLEMNNKLDTEEEICTLKNISQLDNRFQLKDLKSQVPGAAEEAPKKSITWMN